MSQNGIGLARQRRDELSAQIRLLTRRSGMGDRYCEELGLVRESDRVLDLKRHLAQVESLLKVASDVPEVDAAWFSIDAGRPAGGDVQRV
jgi:hypothetical protein